MTKPEPVKSQNETRDAVIGIAVVAAAILAFATNPKVTAYQEAMSARLAEFKRQSPQTFVEGSIAGLFMEGKYANYYLFSMYTVSIGSNRIMCWGVFTQVICPWT